MHRRTSHVARRSDTTPSRTSTPAPAAIHRTDLLYFAGCLTLSSPEVVPHLAGIGRGCGCIGSPPHTECGHWALRCHARRCALAIRDVDDELPRERGGTPANTRASTQPTDRHRKREIPRTRIRGHSPQKTAARCSHVAQYRTHGPQKNMEKAFFASLHRGECDQQQHSLVLKRQGCL